MLKVISSFFILHNGLRVIKCKSKTMALDIKIISPIIH
jgi:hypothetical protein